MLLVFGVATVRAEWKIRKRPNMCGPYCYRSTYNTLKNLCISRQAGNLFQIGGNCLNSLLCTKYTTYLSKIIPNTRGNDSAYRTRNIENYTLPKCRLDAFKKSFVPSAIHLWNSVSLDIRKEISVNKFKTLLSGGKHVFLNPSYYHLANVI